MQAHDIRPLSDRLSPHNREKRTTRLHARKTYREQAFQRDVQLANALAALATKATQLETRAKQHGFVALVFAVAAFGGFLAVLGRVKGWW